jgi:hypothetical protein
MWPSVDHVNDPATPELVLEVRLVNDMKTILSPDEFRDAVGHLACALNVPVRRLPDDWTSKRSFAGPQATEEPPLPA